MKILNYELTDWDLCDNGYICRRLKDDTYCTPFVKIKKQFSSYMEEMNNINNINSVNRYRISFDYKLYVLEKVYESMYGNKNNNRYFAGTIQQVKDHVDEFINKVLRNLAFL